MTSPKDLVSYLHEFIIRQPMPAIQASAEPPVGRGRAILRRLMSGARRQRNQDDTRQENVGTTLAAIKALILSTSGDNPLLQDLMEEMRRKGTMLMLINNLQRLDFESKKDATLIFNNVVRHKIARHTIDGLTSENQSILRKLMAGYENPEIALNCGQMLRECCRAEDLARILLNSDDFYNFFKYIEFSAFDIAADAFSTFKELLTRHKVMCAKFLETNYTKVFAHYRKLLDSDNYVTKRQALKLLGELLLTRHNFSIMTRYTSHKGNLKLVMIIMRESCDNMQLEAFHVFKVFVANPNKPQPILKIFLRNKERLVDFLTCFHNDREGDDEQFHEEKAYVIKQIRELRPAPEEPAQQSENSGNSKNTENSDNSKNSENTENSENSKNSENSENSKNTENTENSDNSENTENSDNSENTENSDNSDNRAKGVSRTLGEK